MSMEEINSAPSASVNEKESKKRKGRGPNKVDLKKIAKAKETGIHFNNYGQPHGETSVPLSTIYGAIANQFVPITYESWAKVPEVLKDSLWETTKTRFGLDEIGKSHVLSSMGSCWRQYKSKITKQIRSVPSGPEATGQLQMLRPDNIVDDEDWNTFVKFRLSPEFDEISRRHTELAKRNDTPQTTGRKGFARLHEELRAAKLANNEDPDEVDRVATWIAAHKHKDGTPVNKNVGEMIKEMEVIATDGPKTIRDDAVAQVLGREHRGRVRGLGFGVTPTKVQASVIGKKTTMQLQKEMNDLRKLVTEMQTALVNMQANINGATIEGRAHSSNMHHQPQYSSSSNPEGNSKRVKIVESSSKSQTEVSSSQMNNSQQNSNKCKLLHWIGSGEVVAEAEIDCIDPKASCHHMILGPYCWRVCVKKILVSKVPLMRPTSDLYILEDTRGTYIAWPSKYIVKY